MSLFEPLEKGDFDVVSRGLGTLSRRILERAAALRARRLTAAASFVMFCVGCSPVALVDERVAQPFADLLRADRSLRASEGRLADAADDVSVFAREIYSDAPGAPARPVLVLLNGVFSDGDTWRFDTALLAARFDLLVMDLPGTGRSVDPDPDGQPETSYTLEWTATRTYQALHAWQAGQPVPRRLVLVGHSIAGAVVLRMLGAVPLRERFATDRAQVDGAVLLATPDVGTPHWSPTFVELAELSDEKVALGDALGVLEWKVETAIRRSVIRTGAALRQEATRMVTAITDHDRRRASQLMMRRIRPTDAHGEPIWPLVREMVDDDSRIDVPVLLLSGRDDDTLGPSTGAALAARIPGARLVLVDEARHSLHQEQPLRTVEAIVDFVDSR